MIEKMSLVLEISPNFILGKFCARPPKNVWSPNLIRKNKLKKQKQTDKQTSKEVKKVRDHANCSSMSPQI